MKRHFYYQHFNHYYHLVKSNEKVVSIQHVNIREEQLQINPLDNLTGWCDPKNECKGTEYWEAYDGVKAKLRKLKRASKVKPA
jgi:hypothetical protein